MNQVWTIKASAILSVFNIAIYALLSLTTVENWWSGFFGGISLVFCLDLTFKFIQTKRKVEAK